VALPGVTHLVWRDHHRRMQAAPLAPRAAPLDAVVRHRGGPAMSRGTRQGSGTWQSSGPDFEGLIGAAVLIGAAAVVIGVLEWLLARIWWVIGGTAVLIAIAVAGFVALSRWTGRREARFAERRRLHLAAAELPHPPPPPVHTAPHTVITGGTHIWLAGIPDAAQAAVIRKAIPRTSGDTTTGRGHHP
jgi:hypothetical protein